MKPLETIKIGIIGAGRIGMLHARNIATQSEGTELCSISDVFPEAAQRAADLCGVKDTTTDYSRILENPEISAVLICSSTDTHAQIIEDAAQAGKNIFCEKPIDLDLQRVKRVIGIVNKSGVKFQVGFNRRFDPNFAKLKEHLSNDKIGHTHILKITSRDPAPPPLDYVKRSGGLFVDMTIHDFDMARFLSGSEVNEVYAAGDAVIDRRVGDLGDIDTALVMLKFENGVLSTIDNSRQAVYGYDQRVEVFGEKGMLQAQNTLSDTVEVSTAQTVEKAKPHYFFLERYQDSYVAEIRAFIKAIHDDTEPVVGGNDGLMSLQIGLAAQKSLAENRPVRLNEVTG